MHNESRQSVTVTHIVDTYKDLGVLFDPLLPFDQHISKTVSKAYSMLGLMQQNFQELSRDVLLFCISPW